MIFRRRKVKPITGTPYGFINTKRSQHWYVKRTTITNVAEIDPGGFVRRNEESIERWDFVSSQPKGNHR